MTDEIEPFLTDIYYLGIIIYEIGSGKNPYGNLSMSKEEIVEAIMGK